MGGLADASLWGVAWAMFAVAAGMGLAAAAIAFLRGLRAVELGELDASYNALAPIVDC